MGSAKSEAYKEGILEAARLIRERLSELRAQADYEGQARTPIQRLARRAIWLCADYVEGLADAVEAHAETALGPSGQGARMEEEIADLRFELEAKSDEAQRLRSGRSRLAAENQKLRYYVESTGRDLSEILGPTGCAPWERP